MTVVSQKKDLAFDFDSNIFAQRDEYIYIHLDGRDIEIGKYKSQKRAKQVFIEMIELNVTEVIYYMPEG